MRDLFLAACIFSLLPLCFARPWFGILVWNWLGMMSPYHYMWGFAAEIRWLALVGGATLAGLVFTSNKKSIPWNTQLVLMVIMLLYFTFTCFFAWVPEDAWQKLVQNSKVIGMAVISTMVIYGRERIRWLLIVIALSIGFYGIKGGFWAMATGGVYRVQGPEIGFMTQNNGIGVGLVMVLPILLALAYEQKKKWQRWGFAVSAGLSAIAVVFTYSRGAWLGLAAVGTLILLRSKKKLLAVLLVAPLIVVGAMWAPDRIFERADTLKSYEEDHSSMQRIQAWIVAWNVAVDNPITGGGFDFQSFADASRWYSYAGPEVHKYLSTTPVAHSLYFQMLGEHGFVAFLLYLSLMLSTLWHCHRLTQRTKGSPELEWIGNYAAAIQSCLIGHMVSGAFLNIAYFDLAWVYYSFTAILHRELPKPLGKPQMLARASDRAFV